MKKLLMTSILALTVPGAFAEATGNIVVHEHSTC